jgi:KDO2-lipid IV(A) lauroyltransferase
MPFWILYRISDFIFFILYYGIGYRKKLVLNNLKSFYPDKSEGELLQIRRSFYRHFVDIFIEMIKTFTISPQELDRRFVVTNNKVMLDLEKKGKSVIFNACHYANWEWTIKIGQGTSFKRYGVYARIRNEVFSNTVLKSRERFGMNLLRKTETPKIIARNKVNNVLSAYGFLSDQSPQLKKSFFWTTFLGQRVPVIVGAETLIKKFDLALVFVNIKKVKRGYYEATFELITENPNSYKNYELTELYLKKCEAQIRKQPEYYFWTHNRLKLVGKEDLSPAAQFNNN